MQTFLPYPHFGASARCLDRLRLGKQRVEAFQLLKGSWPNHPASKMWRGYSAALEQYMRAMILEWVSRGYQNNMLIPAINSAFNYPPWFGRADFHAAHRSNLLRKDFAHYSQFGWTEPTNLVYLWG